jgi:hypothetical protein
MIFAENRFHPRMNSKGKLFGIMLESLPAVHPHHRIVTQKDPDSPRPAVFRAAGLIPAPSRCSLAAEF